jgi:hypothetical protein
LQRLPSDSKISASTFWAYIAGTAMLVGLSFIPSSVHTSYSWSGAVVEAVLLVTLARGSKVSRWLLILGGVLASFGSLAVQSGTIDLVATGWSIAALAVTCLLFAPSMRRFTTDGMRGHRRSGAGPVETA